MSLLQDESGQSVVEYVLGIAIAVMIVGILATGFRRALFTVWVGLTKEVAAACPGCPADPAIR